MSVRGIYMSMIESNSYTHVSMRSGLQPPRSHFYNHQFSLNSVRKVLCVCVCVLSCVQLFVVHQALLSMGFPRQEYWSGLPFPSPGDLLDPGIEPWVSCIAGGFFTIWATIAKVNTKFSGVTFSFLSKGVILMMLTISYNPKFLDFFQVKTVITIPALECSLFF